MSGGRKDLDFDRSYARDFAIMKSDADLLCTQLQETEWFRNGGQPLGDVGGVGRLPTWELALRYCDNPGWVGILRQKSEGMADQLERNQICGMAEWNDTISRYVSILYPLIDMQVSRLTLPEVLCGRICTASRYALPCACMEAHYLGPPGVAEAWNQHLFQFIASWYIRGRFPCGLVNKDEDKHVLLVY